MKRPSTLLVILLVSFLLSVSLGMLDDEVESLWHLFTAEWGNIVTLLLYTMAFAVVGLWVIVVYHLLFNRTN